MSGYPILQAYPKAQSLTLSDGEVFPINRGGSFIHVLEASAEFTIRIDDTHELVGKVNQSYKLPPGSEFDKVEVVNDSGGSLTFRVLVGSGDIKVQNVTVDTISGTVTVAQTQADTYAGSAVSVGTTATSLAAANTDRKALHVRNNGSATIFVGPTGVTTANGYPVEPGEDFVTACTAQLFGIVASGTENARVLEEDTA